MGRFRIGDIFSVALDDKNKKYFQYVADDLTQLNSYVIRCFKKKYPIDETADLREVVKDEVEFFAHVILKFGIKLKVWEKVGSVSEIGKVEALFRDSNDYGNPAIKVSNNWYVWKINEPFKKVGRLEGENRKAEIGIVVSPACILQRMRLGRYTFVYPDYS